jgi:protein-tyrosine phosphatase
VIDLHAHILPGLDDGPRDMDATLALARAAVAAGTRTLAATSHVDRTFWLMPEQLADARRDVTHALAEAGIELKVVQGGEVATARMPALSDDELRALTLGGGPYVLLECPFGPAHRLEALVADLLERGFAVLLAHPERSPDLQRDPARLGRLVDAGALAQVTAGSFAGDFGETPRQAAERMLAAGWLHVLASDAHDAVDRGPDLAVAAGGLQERYAGVAEQLAWMARDAPAAILAGLPLPERPRLPLQRRPARRLRAW